MPSLLPSSSSPRSHSLTAHQGRVTKIVFDAADATLLSCGRDKTVFLNSTTTTRVMSAVKTGAWCSSMAYDKASKTAFVGDYSGSISVIKITDGTMETVTTLQGHTASIRSLEWAAERRLLFSGRCVGSVSLLFEMLLESCDSVITRRRAIAVRCN